MSSGIYRGVIRTIELVNGNQNKICMYAKYFLIKREKIMQLTFRLRIVQGIKQNGGIVPILR